MSSASPASYPSRPLTIATVAMACSLSFFALANRVQAAPVASANQAAGKDDASIRPFHIHVPQAQLVDLRKRIAATRWPDKEPVTDTSQGVPLATLRSLVKYWGDGYDWRKAENTLNALPEFVTTIDGVDIQFIHVRSREPNAMPLILTHGWPGSPLEFLKTIGPLTDPIAYGGRAEDAFDVVIPAIPGYGFSGRPTELGWNPDRVAKAWDVLMKRLGYTRYVSQGGDHGSVISDALARQAPQGLLGIHLNMPATVPANLAKGINSGDPAPANLSADERRAYHQLSTFFGKNAAYGAMMVTRPQTIGYALADSPAGLAAWAYEKIAEWTDSDGHPERVLSNDQILDDLTLYWVTNTGASSSRFYWENNNNNFSAAAQKTTTIKVPVAVTVFPGEIYRAPKSWTEQAYPSLYYFNEAGKGGHFAAWEQPQLFSEELRAAFRPLRDRLLGVAGAQTIKPVLTRVSLTTPATHGTLGSLKRIRAGVLDVAYAELGPADGPVVILLHGWPYDIHSYDDVAPALAAKGYRVLVPYARGYGDTRFLSANTMRNAEPAALASDVIDFMDALQIQRAELAGYDWGARSADIVAALWPERVKALVSVSGYLIGSQESGKTPLAPKAELQWWYQYYFATERGRGGYEKYRHDFAKLIWQLASPQWNFDDATFERSAAALDNPDQVALVIHNYRWRLALAKGETKYAVLEKQLAAFPAITVPTITLEGDANGAPHPPAEAYAKRFTGKYEHRLITGGIGHNLPQEDPQAFTQAVIDADHL